MNFFETTILSYLIVSIVVALAIGISLFTTKHKLKHALGQLKSSDEERKKIQEDLANLQLKYQQQEKTPGTIPDIPVGIISIEKNRTIGALNKCAEELLGQYTVQLHGKPYTECIFFKTADGGLDYEAIEKALSGTKTSIAPWINLTTKEKEIGIVGLCSPTPDGAICTIIPAEAVFQSHSHTQALLAEATDRGTQEAKEHGRSFDITQLSDHCILVSGADDRIVYANPQAEQFFGCAHNGLLGQTVTELFQLSQSDTEIDTQTVAKAKEGQAQVIPRWRFLKSHGARIPVTGSIIPIKTDTHAGEVIFYFADSHTDYEQIEQEKAFFSGAAHDLRAPLTNIRSVIELLQQILSSQHDPDIAKLLANAESSTLQLIALVNDLLNVSRIEQNRITLKKESFDMLLLCDETLKPFQTHARERHLYLEHHIPDLANRKVLADRMKTQEIITNLVSNAIKYTMQGGVTITHRVSDTRLITTITDTGMGISPENQKLLFRKFQQVSIARNLSVTKSTGLGLYISKEFAIMMNGDIVLEKSEAGVGSTFAFSLPLSGS